MVVVVDDEDRENEGDIIMAAVRTHPPALFFSSYLRICCQSHQTPETLADPCPPLFHINRPPQDAVTTEAMAFIVRYCSGVVCVSLEGAELDRLKLPPMIVDNEVRALSYRRGRRAEHDGCMHGWMDGWT